MRVSEEERMRADTDRESRSLKGRSGLGSELQWRAVENHSRIRSAVQRRSTLATATVWWTEPEAGKPWQEDLFRKVRGSH